MSDQNRDIKKLRRADLLELLVDMSKENDRLKAELELAHQELATRSIKMEKAGSLAEAALMLNGIFEAADAACAQYVESMQALGDSRSGAYPVELEGVEAADKWPAGADADKPLVDMPNANIQAVSYFGEVDLGEVEVEPADDGLEEALSFEPKPTPEVIVEEIRVEAERIVADAQEEACQIVDLAEEDARKILKKARKKARRIVAGAKEDAEAMLVEAEAILDEARDRRKKSGKKDKK